LVRTRFAPSPTGSLHVGNARIAVLNWLFTRQQGGEFILRIEDTDVARNVPGAEAQLMFDLMWLGLDWDEGPHPGLAGPELTRTEYWSGYAPLSSIQESRYQQYRQSERLHLYQQHAQLLLERGLVYNCYCTQEELAAAREAAIESGEDAQYPGTCRNATASQIEQWEAEGRQAALRFRVPEGQDVLVRDVVYGDVHVKSDEISDFIVLRSDGHATYNFAVVVDDMLMEITHVIRGVGHLSNTPRQVLLYQAFGKETPLFAHIPMVLGPDRQKLSKRHGAQALADYEQQGYQPEGLVNYLSLLGWSSPSGEEVLSREQLVREISLERVGNADVVFDPVKLSWLSAKHIEKMPLDELVAAVKPFVDHARFSLSDDLLRVAVNATRTHFTRFSDINEQLASFFPSGAGATQVDGKIIKVALSHLHKLIAWDEPTLAAAIKNIGQEAGVKGKALYEPLRITLTGHEHGPPLPAVMVVQGRERVLQRLASVERA
jgi:nondiscriminating glutamyl-tRNA synthetase